MDKTPRYGVGNAARTGSARAIDLVCPPVRTRRPSYTVWSAGLSRRAVFPVPNGRRSGLSGAELTTYRTKGFLWEHENLEPSAGNETPRKPPSPALSRSRGGAFVVVGARESRAHGEGRQ